MCEYGPAHGPQVLPHVASRHLGNGKKVPETRNLGFSGGDKRVLKIRLGIQKATYDACCASDEFPLSSFRALRTESRVKRLRLWNFVQRPLSSLFLLALCPWPTFTPFCNTDSWGMAKAQK